MESLCPIKKWINSLAAGCSFCCPFSHWCNALCSWFF